MTKKVLLTVSLLLALAISSIFVHRLASPEIIVDNVSNLIIEEVVVQMPSNRLVFGEVQPGQSDTIYYSPSQSDGTYHYSIRFPDRPELAESCGYVTNSDYGKRLQLVVLGPSTVECRESNKLF